MKSLQVVRSFPSKGRAMAVAFSNDGKLLAMGEESGRVVVADAMGTILWSFDVEATVASLAWSSYGDLLAVGCKGQVEVWSFGTRVWVGPIGGTYVLTVSWSPEDRLAFSDSRSGVGLWQADDTEEHSRIPATGSPYSVRWCLDSRLAVGLRDGTILVINSDIRAVLSGHTGYVRSLSWSLDERRLASSSADETVRIWDPHTTACLTTLPGTAGEEEVEWIAADILGIANNEKVTLVRPSTQQELASWTKGNAISYKLSLSPSDGLLAVNRDDGFYVLDVSEFVDRPRAVHSAPLEAWAARQLTTVGLRPHLRIASMWVPHLPEASGDCLGCLHGPGSEDGPGLDVTADSRELVSGHDPGVIRAWSLTDGSIRWETQVGEGWVYEVALFPNGSRVAVGHRSDIYWLTLLDSRTGKVAWSEAIPGTGADVRWSDDGSRLLTWGGTLHSAATGQMLVRAEQGCLAILPSGRTLRKIHDCLSVCNDCLEPEYKVGEVKDPVLASVSPQRDRIAIISGSGTVWICRLPSVQPIGSWQLVTDQQAYPRGLAWSPDGEHLATSISSTADGRVDGGNHIRIWRSHDGELVREFEFPEDYVWRVSWAPNGAFIAAGCSGDVIRFFDTRSLCRQPIGEVDRSAITPEHAELARNLVRLHRLGVYPPLSTAESAVQMIGGRGPDPALAAEPGVKRLSDLRWSGSARTALAALLIEDVPFAGWAPPEDASHREVSDALQQALAGAEPIPPEVPGFPAAPIASAAKQISEPFVRMLDLIGEEAVAEEPSIALHLLKRTPQLPNLPSPKLWRYSERSFSGGGGRSMSMLNVGERGGFGPHGDIQSLLTSQWVLPEEVRTYRYLHHELLYRQRLAKAPPRIRPLVVVLDVTAAALGVVEGVTRPAAQVALNRAYEAGVGAWLVLLEGARNRVAEVRSRRDLAEVWTSRGEALGNAADALELARRAKESAGDDGIILVLSHAWFGWDESLPELPGLRGLFVQYPGTRANPKLSCEMWETVDAQHPAAVWDKLGELLA